MNPQQDRLASLLAQAEDDVERERLRELWQRLGALETELPSERLAPRFRRWVEAVEPSRPGAPASRASGLRLVAAVAALALALGLVGGWAGFAVARRSTTAEIAALQAEMERVRLAITVSASRRETGVNRLAEVQAIAVSAARSERARRTLVDLALLDPNTNVRLAAIEALRGRPIGAQVEQELIDGLARAESPLLAIALIDLLVDGSVRAAAGEVRRLAADPAVDPLVRDKADWAAEMLQNERGLS